MKKYIKIGIGILVGILFIVAGLLLFLVITEYRPNETETIETKGKAEKILSKEKEISILTYNIGYGALSEEEDFFMDGGKQVQPDSKEVIIKNIEGIKEQLKNHNTDVVFLQEVDVDSKRSYHVNEVKELWNSYGGTLGYATNFRCAFIPYPWPPVGKVDGGIVTLNKFEVESAERIAFPSSFSWPVSMCQLKRCLLVERTPIEGTDKEMVFVNLHLEAYDSGEGKKIQSEILTTLLKEEYTKGNYVVAGGDFNQYFSCADMEKYPVINTEHFQALEFPEEYLGDQWQMVMDDTYPTSRLLNEPYDPDSSETQYYMLDGFIVSPNVEITSLKTIDYDFKYTDHNPVRITVKLK